MAGYQGIAATSQAIIALLANACPSEFAGSEFRLYQSGNFTSNGISRQGISLYLYNVVPSAVRRNLPPRRRQDGALLRNPLPLDLHYMLSAWATDANHQQRLLGWAMQTIHDNPTIPASVLNAAGPETDIFDDTDDVEIHLQAIPLGDLDIIWKVADSKPQPSAGYIVRMLTIDSAEPVIEAGEVQTRDLRFGHLVTK